MQPTDIINEICTKAGQAKQLSSDIADKAGQINSLLADIIQLTSQLVPVDDTLRHLYVPSCHYTDGVWIESVHPCLQFNDAVTRQANYGFRVPDDFVSFVKIELVWFCPQPPGTGNMYWRFISRLAFAGGSIVGGGTSPQMGTTPSGGCNVVNVQEPQYPGEWNNLAPGCYVGLELQRDATNELDTINDQVRILGVLFTYKASAS